VEMHSKYLRPALYDNLLTIKTTLKELPLHHKIEFHQEVYNEQGNLLNTGKVVLYFLEAKTMQRTTMPAAMKERLAEFFQ